MPVTLFPSAPAVFMGVDQRRVPRTALTEKDALVVIAIDFPVIVENLLKVLPNTANIAVVLGNSPNEQYWLEQLRAAGDIWAEDRTRGAVFCFRLPLGKMRAGDSTAHIDPNECRPGRPSSFRLPRH
jgi:hypothetical protein